MGYAFGLGPASPGTYLLSRPLPTGASICSPWETASRDGIPIHRQEAKETGVGGQGHMACKGQSWTLKGRLSGFRPGSHG